MKDLKTIQKDIESKSLEEQLDHILNVTKLNFTLSTSLSIEDQVLTHLVSQIAPQTKVFTLDTGRLPSETYDLLDKTVKKYSNLSFEVYSPQTESLEAMVKEHGINLMYDSLEKRKLCCYTRKIEPLQRALKGFEGWVTGLRKEQSLTRASMQVFEFDETNNIYKYNPLLELSEEDIWDYIKKYKIPYSRLYEQGYKSIGCAPCSRAVGENGDIRDGRWWWENPEHKECGLHYK